MSRRGGPERIYQAQRAGILMRLFQAEHVNELEAEDWITRWESVATETGYERGSTDYWDAAWQWITEERSVSRS